MLCCLFPDRILRLDHCFLTLTPKDPLLLFLPLTETAPSGLSAMQPTLPEPFLLFFPIWVGLCVTFHPMAWDKFYFRFCLSSVTQKSAPCGQDYVPLSLAGPGVIPGRNWINVHRIHSCYTWRTRGPWKWLCHHHIGSRFKTGDLSQNPCFQLCI